VTVEVGDCPDEGVRAYDRDTEDVQEHPNARQRGIAASSLPGPARCAYHEAKDGMEEEQYEESEGYLRERVRQP
jgi:hypothetical protein